MKSGEKSFINNERIVQLEDVGLQWISDSQLIPTTTWNERLSKLLEFKKWWDHCNVTQIHDKDSKLVNWASHRRQKYRLLKSGNKSFINNERIV